MIQRRLHLNYLLFRILSVLILFDFGCCKGLLETKNYNINSSVLNVNQTSEISEGVQKTRLNSDTSEKQLDKFFSLESSIFKKYMKNADWTLIPGLRDDDDFENWVPPEQIQKDMPFYLAGFDFDNRPFWVIEYGKYNYSRYATGERKMEELFYKYFRYFTYIAVKSRAIKSTDEHRINQHSLVIDFEGLAAENVLNRQALRLQLKLIQISRHFAEKELFKIICINLNQVSEYLFRVCKAAIISLSRVAEIYSTDKYTWGPVLQKYFPKDQLPEWYGGDKGFKPLYVLG